MCSKGFRDRIESCKQKLSLKMKKFERDRVQQTKPAKEDFLQTIQAEDFGVY